MNKFQRNNNNHAIVYARYSSHSQNDASIEQQLQAARQYAQEHNLIIVKEYTDASCTGTDDNRPEFQLMLSEVKKLKPTPSCILLWKGDRLARNRYIATLTKHELKKLGILPIYVTENIDTDTIEGELLDGILEVISQFYVSQTLANVERGMKYNAEHCLSNGSKKYGYQTNKQTGKYEIKEDEAEIVRYIFEQYTNYSTATQIMKDLNKRGIKTLRGKAWRVDSITKILKNPTYKGVYIWRDIYTEEGIPPIVDLETWNKANQILETHKQHNRPVEKESLYPLTSYLFCGGCNQAMSGMYGKSSTCNKTYYYYRCTNKKCKTKNIRTEKIEDVIKALLEAIISNREQITEYAIDSFSDYTRDNIHVRQIQELSDQLDQLNQKQNNLLDAIENGLFTQSTKQRLTEIEQEILETQTQFQKHKTESQLSTTPKTIRKYLSEYKKLSKSNFSEVLGHHIEKIYYCKDYLIAVCKYSTDEPQIDLNLPANQVTNPDNYQPDTETHVRSSRRFSAPPPATPRSNYVFDLQFFSNIYFCKVRFDK